MRKSLFAATAIAMALSAGSAFAADLPSRKAPILPPPPPPPLWTGFYLGLNAGYTWSDKSATTVSTAPGFINAGALSVTGVRHAIDFALASNAALPTDTSGFIGGGQIGYNYQFANTFVAGIEADIQGLAVSQSTVSAFNSASIAGETPVRAAISASKKLDYLGTVRGRVGYLVTPTLLAYATGGLAYGGVSSTAGIFAGESVPAGISNALTVGSFSDTRVGWTAGGGLEWLFLPNWSAKVEYLYYDLGTVNYALAPLTATIGAATALVHSPIASTRFNGHIVRAGVNYHFNLFSAPGPVVAKY